MVNYYKKEKVAGLKSERLTKIQKATAIKRLLLFSYKGKTT